MNLSVLLLGLEAIIAYLFVLGAHSLRRRFGQGYFYALLGGMTAVMAWVTDAGFQIDVSGITFVVGSTVFYTALLLGVFVIYVFDGPGMARIAISTVLFVSILTPLTAALLHFHADLAGFDLSWIPRPGLRINAASAAATFLDLIFLGAAWELLGKPRLKLPFWLRTYWTLLSVLWLDVLIFTTGAFAGSENYLNIMQGTLLSRLIISAIAFPVLYSYLLWGQRKKEIFFVNRPVLAILHQFSELQTELSDAKREIQRRKIVEKDRDQLIIQLQVSKQKYKELSKKYERASTTDEITGVPNRRHFNKVLAKEWKRSLREGEEIAVLIMDFDYFKNYNDQYGHLAGDDCLRRLAAELSSVFQRPGDFFARFGGDEFAAILPDTGKDGAIHLAQKAQDHLAQVKIDHQRPDGGQYVTISIGGASSIPAGEQRSEQLINHSDQALYRAKEAGRNRIHYW